jgi:sugar O-acyltransferase (sialic acid O-acetyltransferase NeuD family)
MQDVIIIGAGGQGLIVAGILLESSQSRAIGFVSDDAATRPSAILGIPILGTLDVLARTPHDAIVVAIGDNRIRRVVTERLVASGEKIATVRHPFTSIAAGVTIGEGAMISAGVVITPGATIGRGVLLNTHCSIDHESSVGDFAHVSIHVAIGAKCTIGEETFIAPGATVTTSHRVGARSVVGASALVLSDIGDDVVAYGIPARVVR